MKRIKESFLDRSLRSFEQTRFVRAKSEGNYPSKSLVRIIYA